MRSAQTVGWLVLADQVMAAETGTALWPETVGQAMTADLTGVVGPVTESWHGNGWLTKTGGTR